jgi:hypothetical protein
MPTITLYFITCHGCGSRTDHGHDSPFEARAAAYAAGWRFPARVRTNRALSKETDDVCPKCAESWTPRPATNRWANRR